MSEGNSVNRTEIIGHRNDQDAAAVLAIVLALSAQESAEPAEAPRGRTVWGDPAHQLGISLPSPSGWWASAMPR